jgi:ribonuclease PH
MRGDQRQPDDLRPIVMTTGYQAAADGSVLVQWGDTWVLCSASVEDGVPPFRSDSGGGWVTAEYAMLPGSTRPRKRRRSGGREAEIQRLIGRSLRMAVDLEAIGPRTITVDCDVLRADGGTRVTSVTGGFVALALAVEGLRESGAIEGNPLLSGVAAVSVGIVDGTSLLDLNYEEDVAAEVDMNIVMTHDGNLVELQGTAERRPFSRQQMDALCELGWVGVRRLESLQSRAIQAARSAPSSTITL